MIQKTQHFNKPQIKSMVIGAPNETCIAGRGTGKTIGILAPKSAQCYFKTMPRSTGVNVNATFTQAYTRTLKELIRGWQMIGYQMDQHFIVGTRPPEKWRKKWKWQGPFAPPLDFKHFVCWYNGATMQIISQERAGSSNGVSIDWIIGDEAKLLNEEKFKTELLPANRGIIAAYADNPYHHGVTLTSDMPVGSAGLWLLNKVNDNDTGLLNDIWQLQTCRFMLKHQIKTGGKFNTQIKREVDKQIVVIDAEVNSLRTGLSFYHEASTLENIHALGIDYIKAQLRDTSQFQFDTQILNIRPLKMENGFYPDFDEEYHGYFSEDSSYFDNVSIDYINPVLDCRKDKDRVDDQPLHIALDHNKRIHPIVTGQDTGNTINTINAMHSLFPDKLKEVLKLWVDYYQNHTKKIVHYWYDHNSVGGENEIEKWQEVVTALKKAKWIVITHYIGQAPAHDAKYYMMGSLFKEDKTYSKVVRFNRENCKDLITSINKTITEQRLNGFGKDKKSEHDPKFPAWESTHYTDALDMLLYGMVESGINYNDNTTRQERILSLK